MTKVHNAKSMTKGMRRKTHAGNVKFPPKLTKVPLQVPDGHLGICLCTKDVAFVAFAADVAEQDLTQLATERYKAMSIALPKDFQDEIIKVTIYFQKPKHLARPKSRVQYRESDGVCASQIDPDRVIRQYGL